MTNICVDAMWSKEYLRVQTISMKNLSPTEREQIYIIIGNISHQSVDSGKLIKMLFLFLAFVQKNCRMQPPMDRIKIQKKIGEKLANSRQKKNKMC
jgi:hypothetical protein